MTSTDYDRQAEGFCERYGLTVTAKGPDDKLPPWDDDHGNGIARHYRVTLRNASGFAPRRLTFDFWGSIRDAVEGKDPTPYGVLACVGADLWTPETFHEFCQEYGYDEDSRKAERDFRRADRFARRLRAFFTDEGEREALGEIV